MIGMFSISGVKHRICILLALVLTFPVWALSQDTEWPVRKSSDSIRKDKRIKKKSGKSLSISSNNTDTPIEFIGCGIWSSEDYGIGIYSFSTSEPSFKTIRDGEDYYGNKGAIFADGKFFCVSEFDFDIQSFTYATLFDATTWRMIKQIESPAKNLYSYCMAQDPTTKIIYGCFKDQEGSGWELGTIDIEKMERTGVVAPINGEKYVSISFSSTGQLYGIGFEEGTLYKIDKHTGERTVVGETEISQMYLTSGEIDQRTDKYYFAAQSFFDTALYEIDLETAEAVEVMEEIPGGFQIMGLHVVTPPAEDKAPAAVKEVSVDFEQGSLSGVVSFKAPDSYFDGEPADGNLSYTITANGESLASGNTVYGKRETVAVKVSEPGMYLFQIRVENRTGKSPVAEEEKWIGADAPTAPSKVTVTRFEDKNIVAWTPVKDFEHGGEIRGEVTYRVIRYPDNVTIASGINITELEDKCVYDSLTAVCYGVRAEFGQLEGAEATSDYVVVGNVEPPYKESFDSKESSNYFSTFDGDKDGNCWEYDAANNAMSSKSNKKRTANDWLFTPPVFLRKNHVYSLSFTLGSDSPFDPAIVEVRLGNSPDATSMNEIVFEANELATIENLTCRKEITILSDGLYYLGFHSIS